MIEGTQVTRVRVNRKAGFGWSLLIDGPGTQRRELAGFASPDAREMQRKAPEYLHPVLESVCDHLGQDAFVHQKNGEVECYPAQPLPSQPVDYRRKADQAWELAGLARQDGDRADEERWTKEARRLERMLKES